MKLSTIKLCLWMHGSCSPSGVNGLTGCNVKYGEWEHNVIFSTRLAIYRGAFAKPLLPWGSRITNFFVCLCTRVCACARARACGCMWGGAQARGRVCACWRVALLIHHATCMRHIILPFVASLYPPLFRHYLMNCTIFGKKLLNTKYVFSFSLQISSETFRVLRRIQRDIAINVKAPSCKVPVIFVGFLGNLNFLDRFLAKKLIHWVLSKTV